MTSPSLAGAPLANDAVAAFVTSGRALFTVVGREARYTFKVQAPKRDRTTGERVAPEAATVRFVSVLTGQNNETDYSFLGTVFEDGTFRFSPKAKVSPTAPSAKAAQWFFGRVQAKAIPTALEVWHHGKCCRCGRTLTVPESIHNGIGPECIKHRG